MPDDGSQNTTFLERLLGSAHRRLLLSFLLAAVYVGFLALCIVPANTDDDWSIALLLSGRIPAEGGLAPFINAALARGIHALYVAQPSVNWYFVVEHLSALLALWALTYTVLTFVRLAPGLVALGFVCCFVMPYCVAASNFTVVAGMATSAGVLLLLARMFHPRARAVSAVVGIALVALGFVWRPKMCIVAAPFVLVALAWKLYLRTHDYENPATAKDVAIALCPFALAALACGGLMYYDSQAWAEPQWHDWLAYNDARSSIADYPMPEFDEIEPELTALGVSANDYDMLRIYMSADIDVLNTELLNKVAALRKPLVSGPGAAIESARSYVGVIRSRLSYFGVIALAVLLLWPKDKRGYLVAALELAMGFVLCTYLLLMQRQVDRAETPVWCYALVCCVALSQSWMATEGDEDERTGLQRAAQVGYLLLVVGSLAVCALGIAKPVSKRLPDASLQKLTTLWNQDSYEPTDVFSKYIAQHEGQSYVLGILQYYRLEEGYKFAYLPSTSVACRTMSTGGWSTGSPYRAYQASLCGATNPITSLLQAEGSQLIAAPEIAERVLTFVHEHYDDSATIEQVEEVVGGGRGDIKVYVWDVKAPKYLASQGEMPVQEESDAQQSVDTQQPADAQPDLDAQPSSTGDTSEAAAS